MSIDHQIEIPPSFIALYLAPGARRPNAPHAHILARYERCEDMATLLTDHAQTAAFKDNLTEDEVLRRCHRGLLADASNFSAEEAAWIVQRLAELLGWDFPDLGDGA